MTELEQQTRETLLRDLKLMIDPNEFKEETLLFDPVNGLGLDSLEALEVATSLSNRFGVNFEGSDESDFQSVKTLAAYIERKKLEVQN
ncbi:MAG: acyl carrier protein [Acidobacteria bacterium]|nr:acyl carrier protein [Acidobacteriota bacterium]